MTDKPYTDADVKLVEQAILHADPPIRRGYINGPDVLTAEARAALDALAAAGRLAPVDDGPRHIIEFRPDGWTIKHPLSCRIGDLFGCRVNLAAEDLDGPPVPPGRYEASVSDIDGRLQIGDRVDQGVTA